MEILNYQIASESFLEANRGTTFPLLVNAAREQLLRAGSVCVHAESGASLIEALTSEGFEIQAYTAHYDNGELVTGAHFVNGILVYGSRVTLVAVREPGGAQLIGGIWDTLAAIRKTGIEPRIIRNLADAILFLGFLKENKVAGVKGWTMIYKGEQVLLSNVMTIFGLPMVVDTNWIFTHRRELNIWIRYVRRVTRSLA